ncbi:glutathione S-transferase family protein [Phenylobacterium sp.]|uniref:glutathione S-transferase family protein n=1 Tax=Phenylobacterium sp. TaxID=1871053 RepID=UPI002F92BC12
MPELILHHYDTSPFSEKPRVMFGVKGLGWRSVIQPVIMPKPQLVPLTGGYRRIPVMQAGADVYCDTKVILAEIERRFPGPKVIHGGDWEANLAADRPWFQATVVLVFGEIGENVPREFIADREKLSGRPFDTAAMKTAAPTMRQAWRHHAEEIEAGLAGAEFLGGEQASLADVAGYMNVWWLGLAAPKVADELLDGLPRTLAWRDRVRAIGHGRRSEMTPAEALDAARAAQPAPAPEHTDPDLAPGDPVSVAADDYGKDPIEGPLVAATDERVTIVRDDADLGRLHIHFPRSGYILARAGS